MPRKFCRYVPTGASRKMHKKPSAHSSSEDIAEETITLDKSTQCRLQVHIPTQDASVEAVEPVVTTYF